MEKEYILSDEEMKTAQCQSYDQFKERLTRCNLIGLRRSDNELGCGFYCDRHWDELLIKARKQSW